MEKGRNQGSNLWQESDQNPIYLDSAYKQLLREDLRVKALQNKAKALQLQQSHIQKEIQNKNARLARLQSVQQSHSSDAKKLLRDKERKSEEVVDLRSLNQTKKQFHSRQMSSNSLQKNTYLGSLKKEALSLKGEHSRLIKANKQKERQNKKQSRDRIHHELAQSRLTIQQFYRQKHQSIVQSTQEEVRNLNQRRRNNYLTDGYKSSLHTDVLSQEVSRLKLIANQNKEVVPRKNNRKLEKIYLGKQEESHPLLRRIDNVMSKYTKMT